MYVFMFYCEKILIGLKKNGPEVIPAFEESIPDTVLAFNNHNEPSCVIFFELTGTFPEQMWIWFLVALGRDKCILQNMNLT